MLRWHNSEDFTRKEINAKSNKFVTRAYAAFALGLTARLLGIQPSKLSVAGVEMTLSNANVIPGFFFLISLTITAFTFSYLIFFGFHIKLSNKQILRIILYRTSAQKKNIQGRKIEIYTFRERPPEVIKAVARGFFVIYAILQVLIFFFPSLFIIIFERSAVVDAILRLVK